MQRLVDRHGALQNRTWKHTNRENEKEENNECEHQRMRKRKHGNPNLEMKTRVTHSENFRIESREQIITQSKHLSLLPSLLPSAPETQPTELWSIHVCRVLALALHLRILVRVLQPLLQLAHARAHAHRLDTQRLQLALHGALLEPLPIVLQQLRQTRLRGGGLGVRER